MFWLLLIDVFVLGWAGGKPAEGSYILIGRLATAYYFLHFLVIVPLLGKLERPRPLPASISEPVLRGGGHVAAGATSARPMEKA